MELSVRAVDCILYNRREWRELVMSLEPTTSTGLVVLPVSRRTGDPVGSIATARASVTFVLDVADRTLARLRAGDRRVARLKWDEFYSHKEIAHRLHMSESTVERRLARIRASVKASLEALGEGVLREFWRQIEGKLTAN